MGFFFTSTIMEVLGAKKSIVSGQFGTLTQFLAHPTQQVPYLKFYNKIEGLDF